MKDRAGKSLLPADVVEKLRNTLTETEFQRFQASLLDETSKPPRIVVIGKAGAGKSTTINALFALSERISHTSTGTLEPKENVVSLPGGGQLAIIDMPGLGEDIELDRHFRDVYRRVLPTADIVLYVIQADMKALNVDQEILRDIVQHTMGKMKWRLVVGLNQVDKIGPGAWNDRFNFPSPEQDTSIERRCGDIQKKLSAGLGLKISQVEYYSALKRFRLFKLLAAMVKAAQDKGWKIPLQPADPVELAEKDVQHLIREELEKS